MTKPISLEGKAQLAGRFMIKAVKADGTERVLADWFDNLILDSGLNRAGTGGIINGIAVGTGTSTPIATQTALDALVAYTTTTTGSDVSGQDLTNLFMYLRRTYRFGAGVAAGNLTEIGAGWSSTSMFSRTLIKDGGGNPTTITVLSDEYLDVTYELRVYWPTTDTTTVLNISGTNYTITGRPDLVGSWGSSGGLPSFWGVGVNNANYATPMVYNATAMGDTATGPTGTYLGNPTDQSYDVAYVNNSLKRTVKITCGLSGITSTFNFIRVYTQLGIHKFYFSPSIPKTNANIFTFKYDIAWARKT